MSHLVVLGLDNREDAERVFDPDQGPRGGARPGAAVVTPAGHPGPCD
jgi:hypothetical protein